MTPKGENLLQKLRYALIFNNSTEKLSIPLTPQVHQCLSQGIIQGLNP